MKKYLMLAVMALAAVGMVLTGCSNSGSGDDPVVVMCKISFDANGGSGTMEDVIVEKGTSFTTPVSAFTVPKIPVGAVNENADIPFVGWNTKKDGSGTPYAAEDEISAVLADMTLYAQWAKPVFSVSEGKKVYFAKGNLNWDGSKFDMERTQYATTPASEGSWNASHVSHFYWSKTVSEAYVENFNFEATRSLDDTFFAANGGAIEGWDVLSGGIESGEWYYLLNTRTDAAEKVGYGTVCGVNGIILLPDVFTDPMKNNGTDAFAPKATTGWTANVYDSGDWAEMEAAGAVFLPAAGFRGGILAGKNVGMVGTYGYYWSSTPRESKEDNAYTLYLDASTMAGHSDARGTAESVRLVLEDN